MNTWMLSMQDSNSPMFDMMIFFHDLTMMILIIITSFIIIILMLMTTNMFTNRLLLQNHLIELIWTFMPMFLLFSIAIPSIKILYLMDEIININLSIKSIGNQWYWNYEYSDFLNIKFNSFMISNDNLLPNHFRLLEVDNRCIMPFNFPIRIISTSLDVIHAWTIPSLGIKLDSIPGRLNQSMIILNRPGMFFGQCSEICGINHSFMPIVIESTNMTNFKYWLNKF